VIFLLLNRLKKEFNNRIEVIQVLYSFHGFYASTKITTLKQVLFYYFFSHTKGSSLTFELRHMIKLFIEFYRMIF
jgi:hypothetical protein